MTGQTTQKKIINAAERLILRQGYDATSLNDVVGAAGVSKGALFHYFKSKQAVSQNILEKFAREQIFLPLEKNLSTPAGIKTGMLRFIEETYSVQEKRNFIGGCLVGNFANGLSDRDEDMREQIKQVFVTWENLLVGFLRPLAAQGKLSMEPRQFARLFIATYEGVMMTAKVHKDHIRASREFMALGQLVEAMIAD